MGLFCSLEITCKPSLSSFLSPSLTHGDLACLAAVEKRANKGMSDQCSGDGQLSYLVKTQ